MLLDNSYTLIPYLKFTLTYDDELTKTIIVKKDDVVTCTYKKNTDYYTITGRVANIALKFDSSSAVILTYIQIDGSGEYSGNVVYVRPADVINLVLITTTEKINDVVCSVDNEDQKIALIRRSEDGYFQYSLDGLTWYTVNEDSASDYRNLTNKPSINGVELIGNKTLYTLGIASYETVATMSNTLINHSNRMDNITDVLLPAKQDKLLAGPGITIDQETNQISTTLAGPSWGAISGTLADQTDLQTALDAKQNLISDTNKVSSDFIDDTGKTHLFVTAEEKEAWNTKQGGLTAGDGIDETELTTNKKIKVINPMSDEQKNYLEDQLFEKNFNVVITADTADEINVFSAPTKVVFTLTSKYSETLVDLVSVPEGWTKKDGVLGTYEKEVTISTLGAAEIIIASGAPTCSYTASRSKIATEKKVRVYKPSYIVSTTSLSITPETIQELVNQDNTVTVPDSNNFEGEQTISSIASHQYVYYIVPKYYDIAVVQFGISIVASAQDLNNITISSKQIGDYQYYRTEEAVGTTSLTAVIIGG